MQEKLENTFFLWFQDLEQHLPHLEALMIKMQEQIKVKNLCFFPNLRLSDYESWARIHWPFWYLLAFHDFRRHCAISALQISKKHFATFDFLVKMKLVSTVRHINVTKFFMMFICLVLWWNTKIPFLQEFARQSANTLWDIVRRVKFQGRKMAIFDIQTLVFYESHLIFPPLLALNHLSH